MTMKVFLRFCRMRMTYDDDVFIESGAKNSNECNFLKTFIEQCAGKKEEDDYILVRLTVNII